MFCQLARLRRCLSPRIRQALDELPETLDETYERTLLDIDEENWAYTHRLFQCIVVACRPLRVEELAEFLAFKLGAGGSLTFEGNWRPENARDTVLSTCSSLIAIVNVGGSSVMQFSHFSVKEYLTSSRIAEGRVSRYYISPETAHIFITQACLSFLLQLDKHVTKKIIKESPLARYAGQYWTDHAEVGNMSSHTEDLIKRLFNPEGHHFANWVWIYDTFSGQSMLSQCPPRPLKAPLHYAVLHSFPRVVEWLITTCSQDVNVSGYSTPLHTASTYQRFMMMEVLLAHHADVNAVDQLGWAPLHYASRVGHLKVARILLEHGADANCKSPASETPLRLLSEGDGDLELAQVLLEHGADPNIRSRSGWDSIFKALENGYRDLLQLLLKHGADPNTRDVAGRTLLHVASQKGVLQVAQGLMELGVDVNSCDNNGQTPLQIALQCDYEHLVQLFLQHGANRT